MKLLVIATQKTLLAARISIALADVGFGVAALTPRGHLVRQSRKIQQHFAYHATLRLSSIIRAIDRWSPDLLVCVDDLAVRELQKLHHRIADRDSRRHLCELIELSLGPVSSFPEICNKSGFLARAELEGLRTPKTIVAPAARRFPSVPADLIYPIVVKADCSYGGMCVRIADSDGDAWAAVWELQTPAVWRRTFRRFFGAILGSQALGRLGLPLRRTISLQQYIPGRPANRAVVCWKGKVLAGISVEAVEVEHESGPASVVRVIDHAEMETFTKQTVRSLELSGFVGFDFVLDASNRAWIIEMNPRVTPICHLSLADGTNLAKSLYAHLSRLPPLPSLPPADRSLIALFPNEIVRSASSEYLLHCQHDVPWYEPEIVRRVLDQALRLGIWSRLRRFLERYLPQVVRALIRRGVVDPRRKG